MTNRFLRTKKVPTGVDEDDVAATSTPLRLLVVEDVQEDIELITLSLENAGVCCQIDAADSLERCDALLNRKVYDAVLADYRLPGLQAPDVLRLVIDRQLMTPFILVTGSLGEEAAVECIKNGMTDYVLKDRLYRLPTVLRRALAEANLKREQQAAVAKIEQQAWRESVLNQIFQAIRESLIIEEVLQTTVDQLQKALSADCCLVVQSSNDQQTILQYLSSPLPDQKRLSQDNYDLAAHFKQALKAGQQIALHQGEDCGSAAMAEFFERHHLRSVLLSPLNYHSEYFGAIALHQVTQHRDWSDVERSLVKAVADQCAIALYQANLYAQAQYELEQRRRVEEQLRHDAFHDGLTGLPNRALFLDRLNHARQISRRNQTTDLAVRRLGSFAVLFLDLDDFRIINDSLGHEAGDFLLQVVAARLHQCLRVGDTLARTSGDEFAILLEDIESVEDILAVVENIQTVLQQSITLESQEIFVSSCIGIVVDAPNYNDASQLLRDADTAMYQAKRKGRNSYQLFNWSMHTEVKQRLRLENDLRRAINREEFYLVYQPIVHLETREIRGFEALLRWQDPEKGVFSPDEFIPVAERTGLILPIGQWVFREACDQWKKWLLRWPASMENCIMSVNLSAKQLAQADLVSQIEGIVRTLGIECCQLRMEITESALMENELMSLEILRQLKSKRIQVAMDDFGTGYSSLSYLLRFPNDALKIDKSFVSNLDGNPDNQEIIKTILALGKNLELDIVAEGIETEKQAQFLVEQGCIFGQGYWFSEPLTAQDAENMLKASFGEADSLDSDSFLQRRLS